MIEQKVFNGDNLELLKQYPDNYFDSIVTDPPYGLGKEPNAEQMLQAWITNGYLEISGSGFMGKEWDAFVPQPLFWKEAFRVLKHGGHVVSFFGTRTYDWGVMAMRLAGFEVRDCIQWLYGSGFPKSHNISKAIDKMGGESLDWFIDYILKIADEKGITRKELTMLFPSKNGNPTGWLWNKQNNQSITLEQYNTIKDYLKLPFENIEEAQREVIGKGKAGLTKGNIANFSGDIQFDITAPSTEKAKQWDGWGSALKPANEPIVLARKPLEKGLSIAENVLKWGTGAINIDGCRVAYKEDDHVLKYEGYSNGKYQSEYEHGTSYKHGNQVQINKQGRFPANLILTHHPDCECIGTGEEEVENWNCHEDCPIRIMDEQSGITKTGDIKPYFQKNIDSYSGSMPEIREVYFKGDKGGASRFFYCAKASKSERNKGLDSFEEKQSVGGGGGLGDYIEDVNSASGKYGSEKAPNKNFHPTVKPVALMRYLVRLITPPNGIVLDPFNGSGTTGIACKLEEMNYVGLELDAEYCKIAQARIDNFVWEDEEVEFTDEQNDTTKSNDSQLNLFD